MNHTDTGLCQWTSIGRKENLYDYAEDYEYEDGEFDISDIYMQLDFFIHELETSYSSIYDDIYNATDAYTAGYIYCYRYEVLGDTESTAKTRGNAAEELYQEYLENGISSSSSIVEAAISVHEYVRTNGYTYGGMGNVPNYSNKKIDCSSFVTWVLIEAGVDGFTSGMYQWTVSNGRKVYNEPLWLGGSKR